MKTVGADTAGQLETVDLYTSHEGLHLEYEQSLTRRLHHPHNRDITNSTAASTASDADQDQTGWYNTSAHFLWIGDRTRQPDGAHVEYFRGVENPIGIKVGPSTTADDLLTVLNIVDPRREIGKVTLITRYGADKVGEILGGHIEAVKQSDHTVVWQCDPMHGYVCLFDILYNSQNSPLSLFFQSHYLNQKNSNTVSTSTGIKTRHFSSIQSELSQTFQIHKEHGTHLGGIHLELTGDAVTECVGGSEGLTDEHLNLNYTTFCDPRLNEKQAIELAFLIAGWYRND